MIEGANPTAPTYEGPISRVSGQMSDALDDLEANIDQLVRRIESVLGPLSPEKLADPTGSKGDEQSSMAHWMEQKADKIRWLSICVNDVRNRVEL